MCFGHPQGDARYSTSATIADRRFRAAIVVPRSLRREPRPDGGPQPFQPRSSSPRFLASCSLSFLSSTAAPPRWLPPCWSLGWWLAPITLYHLVPLYFDAISWRELFPASNRPGRLSFLWMRWIRESVSTLLPVAGVGGDVVGARLAHQRGVPGAQATASMVVDITVGAATQLVFVLVGVVLLAASKTHDAAATAWGLTIGVAIFAAAIGVFVRIQHNSMFGVLIGWAHRLAPKSWMSSFAGRAEAIDEAIVATYRRRSALSCSSLLRLVGWVIRRGRGLAGDARPRLALEPDRFVYPGKPQHRRARRGVHGARERWAHKRAAWSCSGRCSDCPRTWRLRFRSPNGFANWR